MESTGLNSVIKNCCQKYHPSKLMYKIVDMMGVSEYIKITEEEKIAIQNDFDPIEAPPGPYKIQPENQGFW